MDLNQQARQAADEARSVFDRTRSQAESERRDLTASERATIDGLIRRARDLRSRAEREQSDQSLSTAINQLTSGMRPQSSGGGGGSLGTQVVANLHQWWQTSKASLPSDRLWTSPAFEVSGINDLALMATTLDESSGSGGKLVIPDHRPGIVPLPQRPLTIADLCAPGTTDSNLVSYMRETAYANAAAPTAEGTTKPESTLVFDSVSDPVRKLAHWLPCTEEILEDVPALRDYVNARLRLGLVLAEEDQLLSGNGIAPNVQGFLSRSGLAAPIARGTDSNADAILKQIAAIATTTNLSPSGIVINPSNWLSIQLLKLASGEYAAGGGPLGAPAVPMLWGIPVAVTSAITAGTALVGAFATASQIFRKGGLRVDLSNSHSDFFITNKVAIRAEERFALCVYRPGAFGTVTGLN